MIFRLLTSHRVSSPSNHGSASNSERSGSNSPEIRGPKFSRTFVWLRELLKAIPRGKPWDQLNREGRVKEIEFGKKRH